MNPETEIDGLGYDRVRGESGEVAPTTSATERQIMRQRRSAVALGGRTANCRDRIYAVLSRLMPCPNNVPWNTIGPSAKVHLGLFVHRVTDLEPGLYGLVRSPEQEEPLRNAMKPGFAWQKPPGCPTSLPLYLLATGDCTTLAARVSCLQDIAGDGAFSLGMIAEFIKPLQR